jgi:small neutral amino acid transporter SnatA (MarC family)
MENFETKLADVVIWTLIVTTVAWIAVVWLTLIVVLHTRNKVYKILGKEEVDI